MDLGVELNKIGNEMQVKKLNYYFIFYFTESCRFLFYGHLRVFYGYSMGILWVLRVA